MTFWHHLMYVWNHHHFKIYQSIYLNFSASYLYCNWCSINRYEELDCHIKLTSSQLFIIRFKQTRNWTYIQIFEIQKFSVNINNFICFITQFGVNQRSPCNLCWKLTHFIVESESETQLYFHIAVFMIKLRHHALLMDVEK